MKRGVLVWLTALSMTLAGGTAATGGDLDPTGTWKATRSNSKTVGPCPMGGNGSGDLVIEKAAEGFTLTYGEGMVCRPAEVCRLTGSKAKGTYSFTTTVPVDDEGGRVTNTAEIEFMAETVASGRGSSKYVHPEGFSCTWTFDIALSR